MDVILITDAEGEKAYDKHGEEIKLNKMENKELIKKAKEIILKGAKQVNIELPEFEIDIEYDIKFLRPAVNNKNPYACLNSAFDFEEGKHDDDAFWRWIALCDKLPKTINN
jgi:hypothetical protein